MQSPEERQVIHIIAESQQIPADAVTVDSTFEQLGIDSLSAVAVVAEIEEAFGISIPNEEVLGIRDVRQAVACLRRHLPQGSAGLDHARGA